jgi:hypothetical protein
MSFKTPSYSTPEVSTGFVVGTGTTFTPCNINRLIGSITATRQEVAATSALTSVIRVRGASWGTYGQVSLLGGVSWVTVTCDLMEIASSVRPVLGLGLSWAEISPTWSSLLLGDGQPWGGGVVPTIWWPSDQRPLKRSWQWDFGSSRYRVATGLALSGPMTLLYDPPRGAKSPYRYLDLDLLELPADEPSAVVSLFVRLKLSAEMRDEVLRFLDKVLAIHCLVRLLAHCALSGCLFVRSLTLILLAVARRFGLRGESDDSGLPAVSTSSRRGALALA